jgi:Protein of unknown function (DUF1688)
MSGMPDAPSPDLASAIAARVLRDPAAIRARARELLARARAGDSAYFLVGPDSALDDAAQWVATVTRERYPDGRIPYHSRWRHFEAGGVDRRGLLDAQIADLDPVERARAQIELTIVSVLLDAGAGVDWFYREDTTGQRFTRSEGLGVASFHAFLTGMFSSDPTRPCQADAAGLQAITTDRLAAVFQVSADNPLVGLEGRAALLRRLGDIKAATSEGALEAESRLPDALRPKQRGRFDRVDTSLADLIPIATARDGTIGITQIFSRVLRAYSHAWLAPNKLADGTPLGDCWPHYAIRGESLSDGWMPFHKLSQWLTYSLLEPFEWAGVTVIGLDALTGLPEYRNGGLLLDAGVILPKNAALLDRTWKVSDEFIVEWRALTVALLDELAPRMRKILGKTEAEMPLACVLEGGTWAAGRVLAQQLRGGLPPIKVVSDGTVF